MTETTQPSALSDNASWSRDLFLLTLAFGALFFFLLGGYALGNPDEGRYAEIPREMLATGDWVLPRLNGVFYFEKPPLVYWVTAASFVVFGQNEWAARAVPALFGLLGVLMTYAAGRRIYGRGAGVLGAVLLGTSLIYFAISRILILDMAVSVLMAATLFFFILGIREPRGTRRRLFFYGLYVCAALATLSKGLIGVMLPGAVMFFWLLLFNQWHRLRPFYLPTGALLFLAVAAPWHILAAQRNDQWAYFYFVREHWLRFTTTTHARYQPWWFFVPFVFLGVFPWTGYIWPALRSCVPGIWSRRKAEADSWFLVVWVLFIVLFFSRSQSKLIPYILPIFPAMTVLLGAWLSRAAASNGIRTLKAGIWFFIGGCILFSVTALALCIKPSLIRDSDTVMLARPWLLAAAALLVAGSVWVWLTSRKAGVYRLLFTQTAVIAAFYACIAGAYPKIHQRSSRELAQAYRTQVRPGDKIFHYHNFAHDFLFYSETVVGMVKHFDELELSLDPNAEKSGRFIDDAEFRKQWDGPTRVWMLSRGTEHEKLTSDPTFRYHLIVANRRYTLLSNQP